jgi:Fe-S oxidoreductase
MGDGRARSEFNRRMFGDDLYELMCSVKHLFDPELRMNPGKIVDGAPMTTVLRDRILPLPERPIETRLQFEGPAGMYGAADRCMNIGLCRKTDAGVMCPSYMATRDEEASTRGRANALVKALSGPDPGAGLGDERVHEILDLCLECKACKVECPLGVDMAALKSAFLAGYQQINGTPLRSRVFASIRRANQASAAIAPIHNRAVRSSRARAMLDRYLGIARQRPLPLVRRQTLMKWYAQRQPPVGAFPLGDVIFLADSFTSYSEPEIGRAAVELLELAGWRVILEARGCCGRPAISKGLLKEASKLARTMVTRMSSGARQGLPIVGCEPSCVLTLLDEYLRLLPGSEDARSVAARARPVTDLLLEAADEGWLRFAESSSLSGRRVLFHGHCHKKAIVGTDVTRKLLSRIPRIVVDEIDSGCCGMAGSFGFESEHYELSMRIGDLRLFPEIRKQPVDTIVAATGVSCRQQMSRAASR